jgi:predicted DNA-binding WGR domain protein
MLIFLKRTDPLKHIDRWYRIAVEADLFGPCNLVRSWGNRRTSYQRTHVQPMPDEDSAWQLVDKIVARKLRKGYVTVEPFQDQTALPARAVADE